MSNKNIMKGIVREFNEYSRSYGFNRAVEDFTAMHDCQIAINAISELANTLGVYNMHSAKLTNDEIMGIKFQWWEWKVEE